MPNNDLISRAAAIEAVYYNPYNTAIEMIKKVPAVDAAPVVRCKDCQHGELTTNARGEVVIRCYRICDLCTLPRLMDPDWFCADGERADAPHCGEDFSRTEAMASEKRRPDLAR